MLTSAVLCLCATAAHADLAAQHYKRALQYYDGKDYPHAIKEFQMAYRLRQLPKILLSIGQVYRKLGMASTALKFYEHYLRVEPSPKPEIKAEVDRYIAQTHAMLDPPEFVPPPSNALSPAEAAAAAVASAPSNVTSVTVPELYADDDPAVGVRPGARSPRQPTDGAANLLPNTAGQPEAKLPLVPTQPGAETPVTKPEQPTATPFYKQPWFWGIVGGVAGAALITGVAVGAQRGNSLPPDVLHPTK